MANMSDAFGTIRVEKVGVEFLKFLNKVQGEKSDAYYTLVDRDDLLDLEVDEDGYLSFEFNTMGRWSYESNIEGYLRGDWLNEEDQKARTKFLAALKKGGSVTIEYSDSDSAMDWMGDGSATLEYVDGELSYSHNFKSEELTIANYANQQGESERWALEYLKGDDVAEAYEEYLEQCAEKGKEPASADKWYDTIYEHEEE